MYGKMVSATKHLIGSITQSWINWFNLADMSVWVDSFISMHSGVIVLTGVCVPYHHNIFSFSACLPSDCNGCFFLHIAIGPHLQLVG